jgi:hypothetical protein
MRQRLIASRSKPTPATAAAFLAVDSTQVYVTPIARRPTSVMRRRLTVNVPPSTFNVSVTTVANPAIVSVVSVSRDKP